MFTINTRHNPVHSSRMTLQGDVSWPQTCPYYLNPPSPTLIEKNHSVFFVDPGDIQDQALISRITEYTGGDDLLVAR